MAEPEQAAEPALFLAQDRAIDPVCMVRACERHECPASFGSTWRRRRVEAAHETQQLPALGGCRADE